MAVFPKKYEESKDPTPPLSLDRPLWENLKVAHELD